MIGIISYGLGNTMAIRNVLNDIGDNAELIIDPNQIDTKIDKLILPGVGSFDSAMQLLKEKNFIEPIKMFVKNKNNFLLGICVGMQILANSSEEGKKKGLSLIPGKIKKFKNAKILPHVGWNKVTKLREVELLKDIKENSKFYFLHSYYYEVEAKNHIAASSSYFTDFTSIVINKNIFGVQFHPEKSHQSGRTLLKNFARINGN